MKAAIYTRVSTDIQVEEGFSLDAQLHRLNAYCESQGWSIHDIYTDEGLSAKNTERPELQRMLKDIAVGKIQVVLVYRLDRLTRSVLDLHELLQVFDKYDVGFKSSTEVFDTTTAMGRLFITIVAALAQWERENLGERVKMGMAQKARDGNWMGTIAPVGYRADDTGVLQIVEEEAKVIRDIYDLYISGKGARGVAAELNSRKSLQRKWSNTHVMYIVSNPVYMGKIRFGEYARSKVKMEVIVEDGPHEAIISEALWKQAQEVRLKRTKMPSRAGTGQFTLTGLIRCGKCGGPMIGKTIKRPSGKIYRSYVCHNKSIGLCDAKMGNTETIEESMLKLFETYATDIHVENIQKQNQDHTRVLRELEDIEWRKKRWLDAFETGAIDAVTMKMRLQQLTEQSDALKATMNEPVQDDTESLLQFAKRLQNIRALWEAANIEERKEIARSIVSEVRVVCKGKNDVDIEADMLFS